MLRCRLVLPALSFLALAVVADAQQNQPPAKDFHGDPLPAGAVARLGTVRFRHDATIVFAAFLPGGKSVVSVGHDSVVCVWEFPAGKEIRRFEAHPADDRPAGSAGMVDSATMSPDGKHLTVFCKDGFMRVWDLANAKQLGKVASTRGGSANFGGGGSANFGGAGKKGKATSNPGTAEPVYSPDGKTLLLVEQSRVLQLVDLPTGKEIGPSLSYPVVAIAFTPDGSRVMTKDTKAHNDLWDATTGKKVGTNKAAAAKLPSKPGDPTIISPDGRFGLSVAKFANFAIADAGTEMDAVLFDTATGKELSAIALEVEKTAGGSAASLVYRRPILFSPDSKILAVSAGEANEKVVLYEVPSGKLLRTLEAARPAPAGAGGGGGKRGGGGGAFQLPVGGIQGKKGGAGGGAGGFGTITAAPGKLALVFSSDGKLIALHPGTLGSPVVVFDTGTGKKIASLAPKAADSLTTLGAFSPDGHCLALDMRDGTVTLFELATGQPRRTYGNKGPAASPATADLLQQIQLLQAQGQLQGGGIGDLLDSLGNPANLAMRWALAPSGKLLAITRPDRAIGVWDVISGKELAVFKGHTDAVNALAFAPHGKTLASCSADATALIWDVGKLSKPAAPAKPLPAAELDARWLALAGDDAGKAFEAMADLAASPKNAVVLIKDRLKPAAPLDVKRVEELIGQLDDKQFKVRDQASAALLKLGDQVLDVLDKAVAGNPSMESRRRLEDLRAKITNPVLEGERVQAVRGVEVLELIGTPQAREVLQALAAGAPGALITTSAQAALKR